MTSAQKAKITGLGYDENFGGLDLSGCPSLQSLPSEDWIDDRFAQPDRTGNGNDLKDFKLQTPAPTSKRPYLLYSSSSLPESHKPTDRLLRGKPLFPLPAALEQ
jgi:hypothetical protein